jgi:hypothetical protein
MEETRSNVIVPRKRITIDVPDKTKVVEVETKISGKIIRYLFVCALNRCRSHETGIRLTPDSLKAECSLGYILLCKSKGKPSL